PFQRETKAARDRRTPKRLLLPRVSDLLEVQLDHAGIILTILRLHVLDDLGAQLARQLAPLLPVEGELLGVERAGVGRTPTGGAGGVGVALRLHLLRQLLGGVLERLGGPLHRRLSSARLALAHLVAGLVHLPLGPLERLARLTLVGLAGVRGTRVALR